MQNLTQLARLRYWSFAAVASVGIFLGVGLFTFNYAEGLSYFSDDPSSCMNCHIMRDQFEGWNHSTHKAVAGCNDCHSPHTFPDKWIVKGVNGFNHSLAFTLENFHEPIRIKAFNERVALDNCIYCHGMLTSQMHLDGVGQERSCLDCHQDIGH
jgi:cytochrome c nitrite reductase small subunit